MTVDLSRFHIAGKAALARLHGARYSWTIASEAVQAGIPYAVAFALCEQESGFRNVFGHDVGGPFPGQRVTNAKVSELLTLTSHGGVSNGVGFTQLTFPGFIRQAHALKGGARKVRNQCRVAFGILAEHHRRLGNWHDAYAAYNGAGPAAENYARIMDARVLKWRANLVLRGRGL